MSSSSAHLASVSKVNAKKKEASDNNSTSVVLNKIRDLEAKNFGESSKRTGHLHQSHYSSANARNDSSGRLQPLQHPGGSKFTFSVSPLKHLHEEERLDDFKNQQVPSRSGEIRNDPLLTELENLGDRIQIKSVNQRGKNAMIHPLPSVSSKGPEESQLLTQGEDNSWKIRFWSSSSNSGLPCHDSTGSSKTIIDLGGRRDTPQTMKLRQRLPDGIAVLDYCKLSAPSSVVVKNNQRIGVGPEKASSSRETVHASSMEVTPKTMTTTTTTTTSTRPNSRKNVPESRLECADRNLRVKDVGEDALEARWSRRQEVVPLAPSSGTAFSLASWGCSSSGPRCSETPFLHTSSSSGPQPKPVSSLDKRLEVRSTSSSSSPSKNHCQSVWKSKSETRRRKESLVADHQEEEEECQSADHHYNYCHSPDSHRGPPNAGQQQQHIKLNNLSVSLPFLHRLPPPEPCPTIEYYDHFDQVGHRVSYEYCQPESPQPQSSSLCYRSSIRIMVRPEAAAAAAAKTRASSVEKINTSPAHPDDLVAKSAKKLSAAAFAARNTSSSSSLSSNVSQRSIVKEQFRLPRDLMEKMPSASNSPMVSRRGLSGGDGGDLPHYKNRQPLSVASMVRRFERDASLESSKTRGGALAAAGFKNSDQDVRTKTPLSSRASSLSSSQGLLHDDEAPPQSPTTEICDTPKGPAFSNQQSPAVKSSNKKVTLKSVSCESNKKRLPISTTTKEEASPTAAKASQAASASAATPSSETTRKPVPVKSQSTGIVARAKNALNSAPPPASPPPPPLSTATTSTTATTSASSAAVTTPPAASATAARSQTKRVSVSSTSSHPASSEGRRLSSAAKSGSTSKVSAQQQVKKASSDSVPPAVGAKMGNQSSSSGSRGLVATRKKQLHEQQSKSSPISPLARSSLMDSSKKTPKKSSSLSASLALDKSGANKSQESNKLRDSVCGVFPTKDEQPSLNQLNALLESQLSSSTLSDQSCTASPVSLDMMDSPFKAGEEPEAVLSSSEEDEASCQVAELPVNRVLSNVVRVKRSESDGIVVAERPKSDRQPVRRCESTDDASSIMGSSVDECSKELMQTDLGLRFPSSIKTVASATIVKGPEDAVHSIGQTVQFKAHYFSNPEPRVTWLKNGVKIKASEDSRVEVDFSSGESTLSIRELRADDSGKYEIVIENEVGSDSASASLGVEGPPEPPACRPFVGDVDLEARTLTLAWYGSAFDGGSIVTGYVVEMSSWPISSESSPPEATEWTSVTSDVHNSTSLVVKNLLLNHEYIFRVKAVNVHGESAPSRISEPVSLASQGSSNEDNDDEDTGRLSKKATERPSALSSKRDEGKVLNEEEDEDEDEDEDEEEEKDPAFDAPFEHRIVELQDGAIFKSKYEIYEELGRGRFGVVFKVKDNVTGEVLAAKFVRCRKSEEKQKVKDEISIMNVLDHSKLLQLATAYENAREMIMVMEYIGGGELFEKVVADDFTLTEKDCVLFMRQICDAVGYMHQRNIVHLDLKPENILCKSKSSHLIKIIDFGLTRKLKRGEDVRILFGTPEFVSPEVISYEPVSTTSDMWSVGVVCYVLLSGLSPFMGDSDVETFANISGISYDFEDEAFDSISEEAKDFIRKLLVKHQNRRMTAAQCLEHPWLKHTVHKSTQNFKEINTEKLKSFLMRRRWQKAAHAIRALGRFTSLGFRADSKDSASSITALSTQSADF